MLILAPASPFLPHLSHGCVSEEVLYELVCDCGGVACLNLCQVSLEMDQSAPWKGKMFKSCPLVWGTDASFGLTPF